MRTSALAALAMLALTVPSVASHLQSVTVRYHQYYTVTQWLPARVEFATGFEITKLVTGVFDPSKTFAIVPDQGNSLTVLELEDMPPCSTNFTASCLPVARSVVRGYDKQGQAWEICLEARCP